ncbi:NAD(P)H-dependent oxidoreductase [Filimonas effusa]|uniref:NAD(P)H-dependent oxidoreductase n=1 Tax=Filimonas effusa TaxID=2508721 RepID=A0A4Q1D129_9BACT|nr:NAD(P)H-dependent oxidoreductase [Filimonas effusa]RXK81439.1 NAD(P)H-dependent oxidoreductase [Filimonas effusa]
MSILNDLQWRYATKKMNGQPVAQEKVDYILEAARLAPTSVGIQPVEVIVVTNKALLEKIQPIAFNQPQITTTSHLLVFAAWDSYTPERINKVFDRVNAERNLPYEATADYRQKMLTNFAGKPAEEAFQHTARQAYISFGMAIAAAAEQKVDATPMEGFDAASLDKLLELDKKGLRSVTLLPLGYRDAENDWLVNLKKVRKPKEEFVTVMS